MNNSNKNVLVIKLTPYNGLSSSNLRMLAMIHGLLKLNFRVDLVTIDASATTKKRDLNDFEFLSRVNIINIGHNETYEKIVTKNVGFKAKLLKPMRSLYRKLSIYGQSGKLAKKINIDSLPTRFYEYVISVSDPKSSHLALINLIKQGLKANKIIEYWGDPMCEDITRKNITPRFILKREEKKLLSVANRIVYTSPYTLKNSKAMYPSCAQRMDFTPTGNIKEKNYPKTNNEKFVVGYYGAYFSYVRNIIPLYNACSSLDNVELMIYGDTDLTLDPKSNIFINSRADVRDIEPNTDLFVCVLNSHGTQIPGKLYHNAATNRPCLVIVDGDEIDSMIEYVKSFKRFLVCKNNENEIKKAILKASNLNEGDIRSLPSTNFMSDVVARKVLGE